MSLLMPIVYVVSSYKWRLYVFHPYKWPKINGFHRFLFLNLYKWSYGPLLITGDKGHFV